MNNEESQEEMLVRIKGEANPMALGREHNKQHNYKTHWARIEAFGYLMRRQTENLISTRRTNKHQLQIHRINNHLPKSQRPKEIPINVVSNMKKVWLK